MPESDKEVPLKPTQQLISEPSGTAVDGILARNGMRLVRFHRASKHWEDSNELLAVLLIDRSSDIDSLLQEFLATTGLGEQLSREREIYRREGVARHRLSKEGEAELETIISEANRIVQEHCGHPGFHASIQDDEDAEAAFIMWLLRQRLAVLAPCDRITIDLRTPDGEDQATSSWELDHLAWKPNKGKE